VFGAQSGLLAFKPKLGNGHFIRFFEAAETDVVGDSTHSIFFMSRTALCLVPWKTPGRARITSTSKVTFLLFQFANLRHAIFRVVKTPNACAVLEPKTRNRGALFADGENVYGTVWLMLGAIVDAGAVNNYIVPSAFLFRTVHTRSAVSFGHTLPGMCFTYLEGTHAMGRKLVAETIERHFGLYITALTLYLNGYGHHVVAKRNFY
jgi:hypothetical protein